MPGMYPGGRDTISPASPSASSRRTRSSTARDIAAGDVLVGIASSGPHSNGFSLIRRIVDVAAADLHQPFDAAHRRHSATCCSTPTRIYVKPVLALAKSCTSRAWRTSPAAGSRKTCRACCRTVQARDGPRARGRARRCSTGCRRTGHVADDEMHRVFNCGIGMVLAVGASNVAPAIAALQRAGEKAFDIGEIVARPDGAPHAIVALTVASRPPRALPRTWRSHASRS